MSKMGRANHLKPVRGSIEYLLMGSSLSEPIHKFIAWITLVPSNVPGLDLHIKPVLDQKLKAANNTSQRGADLTCQ